MLKDLGSFGVEGHHAAILLIPCPPLGCGEADGSEDAAHWIDVHTIEDVLVQPGISACHYSIKRSFLTVPGKRANQVDQCLLRVILEPAQAVAEVLDLPQEDLLTE